MAGHAPSKPQYVRYSDMARRGDRGFMAFISGMFVFMGVNSLTQWVREGQFGVLKIVLLGIACLFVLVAVGVFVFSIHRLIRRPKMPKNLRAA